MTKEYLKIAWRNILKEKWFSLINIFGLAAGMAAFILLYSFILHEKSFDKFHAEGEKIYRVISSFGNDGSNVFPRTLPDVAEQITEQLPEVEFAIRMKPEIYDLQLSGQEFKQQRFLLVDEHFVDIFSFKVLEGNLRQTLADPASIAITKSLSDKLFGDSNPIGQIVEAEQHVYLPEKQRLSSQLVSVKVGALLQDPPKNSHIQFSVLQAFDSYDKLFLQTFSNDVFVYFKTKNILTDSRKAEVAAFITKFATTKYGETYKDILSHSIQSLTDIHFGPKYAYDIGLRGDKKLIYVFTAVAFFILFIAIINFANLVTARSQKRAVEAAIRKVSGASRSQIFFQFIGESILLSFIALLFALMMAELSIYPFSQLLDRKIELISGFTAQQIALFLLLTPVVGFLAGVYPALVFSGFQPMQILRGKSGGGSRTPLMRIILVIVQFSISVMLIVAVMVFNRQIHFMKNADLGFSADNVLVFSGITERLIQAYEPLKAELMMHPGIENVSSSQAFPGSAGSGMSLRTVDQPESFAVSTQEYRIGRDFNEIFNFNLKQGRWFDFDSPADKDNFIINESAAKAIGLVNPVGQEVVMWRRTGKIIGVVEDFHYSSLKNEIKPLVLTAYSSTFYHITIKINPELHEAAIKHIKSTFNKVDPNYVYDEWYLDGYFKRLYKQEENNNKILNYASLLAILIAMMGVLGLSSYIIVARTKEIGIRKVLGASNFNIVKVIFSDITRWILIANLIAWPIAWLAMSDWLQGFPYRIEMSLWFLFAAGSISLIIVLITIGGQTVMAAQRNPSESLKGE
ncbi:MAG: ABC transporter permease [Bacteroidetes bacterium]|nr:ABC transporter permease [Bacteroidota bacterium]